MKNVCKVKKQKAWILTMVGVLLVLCLLSGCSSRKTPDGDIHQFFIREGVFMTGKMKRLAQSSEYKQLYGTPAQLQEITDQIAQGDYQMPQKAYLINLPPSLMTDLASMWGEDVSISEEMEEIMSYRINGTFVGNFINGRLGGADMLAAASTLSWGKSYIQPKGWKDNVLLWLQYNGDFSSIVSFNQSGDGVISANSIFVITAASDSEGLLKEGFEEFLENSGLDLEVTEFSESEIKTYLEK